MSEKLETAINDYISQFLLAYFRSAVSVRVDQPSLDTEQDLDLLKLHWSISEPVTALVGYLREHQHEIQAVLETRRREDDVRVRGRLDARATALTRMVTGNTALMVSHEPLRTYNSGPNHLLIWVLEQAWRLVLRFEDMLPPSASYLQSVQSCAQSLETIRRFDTVHQAAKQLNLTRRPGLHAINEASRSRRPIYYLAFRAYRSLQAIERGDEAEIARLLNSTLLGPLQIWQRFELAVGVGLARALSKVRDEPLSLRFLGGGPTPLAQIGPYEVHWQTRTEVWNTPPPEPSELATSRLLEQYGLSLGADRPDLVVLHRGQRKAVAVVEVKYFATGENNGSDALRAAVAQLVRYARGYRSMHDLPGLLDHSMAAMIAVGSNRTPSPRPYGLPRVVDFADIKELELNDWARQLITATETPEFVPS